eukprot:gene8920-10155_t
MVEVRVVDPGMQEMVGRVVGLTWPTVAVDVVSHGRKHFEFDMLRHIDGTSVTAHGLVSATQLNGLRGVVRGPSAVPDDTRRVAGKGDEPREPVDFGDPHGTKLLRLSCLRPCAPQPATGPGGRRGDVQTK